LRAILAITSSTSWVAPRQPFLSTAPYPSSLTLEVAWDKFLRTLEGKNRSKATIRAYATDLSHFTSWIHTNSIVIVSSAQIERADLIEYLAFLGKLGLMGVSRARKLTAIREFFRFLELEGLVQKNPANGVETPRRERSARNFLTLAEYTRMLSLAGGNPRDYCLLQVFLQTGVRLSELVNLRIADIDLQAATLRVADGKGMAARDIELEKRGIQAIKNYLLNRPQTLDDHLFLNYQSEPISECGVRKLVAKYKTKAGITKNASCHSLRHTFGTYKAGKGVSPFQLQRWLMHKSLSTTQIYVHLGRENAKKVMEATSL
jgi:site-specific recombinase XerD